MRGRDGTADARSNARTVGALGNVVQDRAGSVAHLVGLEQRSAATRGSGVLSPKIRSGRLVSRRLPLTLALALERVLVGSKNWSSHSSICRIGEACIGRVGRKGSGNTDSISRRWCSPSWIRRHASQCGGVPMSSILSRGASPVHVSILVGLRLLASLVPTGPVTV